MELSSLISVLSERTQYFEPREECWKCCARSDNKTDAH